MLSLQYKNKSNQYAIYLKFTECCILSILKKKVTTTVGKGVEKLKLLCTAYENIKSKVVRENSLEVPPNVKHRITK